MSEGKIRESAFGKYTFEGEVEEYFDEELAVKQLVEANILDVVFFPKMVMREGFEGSRVETISLGISTSDMFYFASSATQYVSGIEELKELYREFERDSRYGVVIWLSRREGIQPCRRCYINPMKAAGAWTEEMEALSPGPQS